MKGNKIDTAIFEQYKSEYRRAIENKLQNDKRGNERYTLLDVIYAFLTPKTMLSPRWRQDGQR